MSSSLETAVVLDGWLRVRASDPASLEWLSGACERAAALEISDASSARFHMAFGTAARRFARTSLSLSESERAQAHAIAPGLAFDTWTLDQLARARLLVALPTLAADAYVGVLDDLCADADLQELIALYQSLALLHHPDALKARAAEGVRSNMQSVVEAVALGNPYPAAHLDDGAFAQLVLKCVFIGAPLHEIVGLDSRLTPQLARMLVDYARERRAAGRSVPSALWRCVGPLAQGPLLGDLRITLEGGSEVEKLSALLSMRGNPAAASLLADHAQGLARLDALAGETTYRTIDGCPDLWRELAQRA